jgi:glutathione S-transferase
VAASGSLATLMPEREIRLYGIPLSHPVLAVRGMLELKRLAYRYVDLLAGTHPANLWALGFRRTTVPAMKLPGGERAQGSLVIAGTLERLRPEPALYPDAQEQRAAAQEAERWGESVLQPVPRRLIRWGLRHRLAQRRWYLRTAGQLPAPALAAVLVAPLASVSAWQMGASDARVKQDLADLPRLLDEVDELLDHGVIGGEALGAADFQIGTSVRVLTAMEDVGRLLAGRASERFARRVLPEYPRIPAALPRDWLPAAG